VPIIEPASPRALPEQYLATPPVARFYPDRRYTALAGGGAIGALLTALITDDAGGRLLAAIAAVLLTSYVIADFVFSPRLTASYTGLVINSPFTRANLTWDQVVHVRPETRIRAGLRSTTLEIDADPVLAVLSRRTLGAEPAYVADVVEAFRPS
jgi:hypothetical protein